MLIKKVHAFTEKKTEGNPAGVVLKPMQLSEQQMKHISKILQVSETAYVFPSTKADYYVRFFSPTTEVDLCGHATIATFFTMAQEHYFPTNQETIRVTQETKSGILPVTIFFKQHHCDMVMMTQKKPEFHDINLNTKTLAQALNIKENAIDTTLPQQSVSTGLFTLPICIKTYTDLYNMKPDFQKIKKICTSLKVGSFHVFTFETLEKTSTYHARNFAPIYGINEDPVTGTANGAVASYLLKNNIIHTSTLICEQGDIIGKPGRVHVTINDSSVQVGGKAIIAEQYEYEV